MESRAAVRVRVTGRVQGVSFRAWVRDEAERLGLAGWVQNERDGSVTALLAGPEARLSEMVEGLWRGPPAARVSGVATEPAEPDGSARFHIRG
jgi:acylphosphatase